MFPNVGDLWYNLVERKATGKVPSRCRVIACIADGYDKWVVAAYDGEVPFVRSVEAWNEDFSEW